MKIEPVIGKLKLLGEAGVESLAAEAMAAAEAACETLASTLASVSLSEANPEDMPSASAPLNPLTLR